MQKFIEQLPNDDSSAEVQLESLNGWSTMIEKFKSVYLPIYYKNLKESATKNGFLCFYDLCKHYTEFYSSFSGLQFNQVYSFIRLNFDMEQIVYLTEINITSGNELLEAAKNYDRCMALKQKIEEDRLAREVAEQEKEAAKNAKSPNANQNESIEQQLAGSDESLDCDYETDMSIQEES